ncbi:MAG: uroporphyrinogen decarboxylase family protein [Anaerolineales bacterium]|jgi:uroporphyrinogen decarboxylase
MTPTHRERLQACLNGETTDRPPVALWRHYPVDDQASDTQAAATLNFQKTYDFDLVKVTPASSFCLRDWGVEDVWEGHTEGTRRYTKRLIQEPGDWDKLSALDPSAPHLAAQLACLRQIRAGLGPDTPMLQTVFSPLAQAKNLLGGAELIAHIRKYPEAVMKGLEVIALTTQRFVEAAFETGVDGIFYAIQHAQAGLLTLDEYKTFGIPFDHKVLEPASESWCNLLHLHGRDVYFEIVEEFNFPIVNWHDREYPPSLAEAQKAYAGVVCGGLRQDTLVYRNQDEVWREAKDAIAQTKGQKFILSTGCVVPVIAPHGNIMAARESVE